MKQKGKILLLIVTVGFASFSVNSAFGQNNFANLWGLYGFSHNFSTGLSYNYSNISHNAYGLDVRYRWFSLGVETDLGNRYREIHTNKDFDSMFTAYLSNELSRDMNPKYNKLMLLYHILYRGEVYLNHISLGCSYGLSSFIFYNIDHESGHGTSRFIKYKMLRPYIGWHIPLFDERLLLSLRVGYDIGLNYRVINDGISLGFGLSTSF